MKWKTTKVGNIITTKKGFAFKSSRYIDSGIPIVRVSDFTTDSISNDHLKYYPPEEKANYIDFILHKNDIIIQTVGSWQNNPASVVGKVVHVPYYLEGALLNQNAVKIIPIQNVDRDFLYYRLRCDDFKGHVISEARGAANQASITLDTIKSFEFLLPEYEQQCRISSILTAYDDLIENNRKQIKLLEESAQRLYKEWFVDLRFPGHENTPIVDCIPKGWKKRFLGEIADVIMGQSPKSKFYNTTKEGLPFHQGVGSYGNRFVIDEVYSTFYTRIAESKSILFSVRAPVGRLNITHNKIVIGRGIAAIKHRSGMQNFLFYMLKDRFFRDNLVGNGSIFDSISKDELLRQKFVVPDVYLVEQYNSIVTPIDEKISLLDKEMTLLSEARDRLLPKLMNGEIEV